MTDYSHPLTHVDLKKRNKKKHPKKQTKNLQALLPLNLYVLAHIVSLVVITRLGKKFQSCNWLSRPTCMTELHLPPLLQGRSC